MVQIRLTLLMDSPLWDHNLYTSFRFKTEVLQVSFLIHTFVQGYLINTKMLTEYKLLDFIFRLLYLLRIFLEARASLESDLSVTDSLTQSLTL